MKKNIIPIIILTIIAISVIWFFVLFFSGEQSRYNLPNLENFSFEICVSAESFGSPEDDCLGELKEEQLERCNIINATPFINPNCHGVFDASYTCYVNCQETENEILFKKIEFWGPCPQGEICRQSTKLYSSGKLISKGGTTNLQTLLYKEDMNQIVERINASNIINKDCSSKGVLDYWANYTINIDNQEKTIKFPGCKEELEDIEDFILGGPQSRFCITAFEKTGNCPAEELKCTTDCRRGGERDGCPLACRPRLF